MIQLSVQFTQFVFQAFSVGHISLIFIKTKKFKPLEIRTALFITLIVRVRQNQTEIKLKN